MTANQGTPEAMGSRGFWLVSTTATLAVLLVLGVAVSLATGGSHETKAPGQRPVQSGCAKALLIDWRDGRIDGTYGIRCYRAALKSLPPDLEVYSSAADDIAQALSERIVQSTRKRSAGTGVRRPAG